MYGAPASVAASEHVTSEGEHAVVDAEELGDARPAEGEQGQPAGQAQEEQEIAGRPRFGWQVQHSVGTPSPGTGRA